VAFASLFHWAQKVTVMSIASLFHWAQKVTAMSMEAQKATWQKKILLQFFTD
jgi:hypothetical protein